MRLPLKVSLTFYIQHDLARVEKVSLNGEDLVNYAYLADGTKVSALDSEGNGLLYLGSLIYRKQGETISLESAAFAGGSRWNVAAGLKDETNRFRYNSKEEQFRFGTPYIDYGARQYDPIIGRWFAQDPLSEKYYDLSPYAFCGNNPIRYEDVDGEDLVDKAQWLQEVRSPLLA